MEPYSNVFSNTIVFCSDNDEQRRETHPSFSPPPIPRPFFVDIAGPEKICLENPYADSPAYAIHKQRSDEKAEALIYPSSLPAPPIATVKVFLLF